MGADKLVENTPNSSAQIVWQAQKLEILLKKSFIGRLWSLAQSVVQVC